MGQTKKIISIPTYKSVNNRIDTTLWYKWKNELAKKINLKNLIVSDDSIHYRFWTDFQAIDLWTNDGKSYFGLITNYAQKYNDKLYEKNIEKIDTIFSNQIKLDNSKASDIFYLINIAGIASIPTCEEIKGWGEGLDGYEFIIERATKNQYDFKTYFSPASFIDSLDEAKKIQMVFDKFYKEYKFYDYFKNLKLPKGRYKRNGITGIKIEY